MKHIYTLCFASFALLHAAGASAAGDRAPAGRIFYAPFEGSLDATEARGDKTGEAIGKPEFAEGRRGQGLVVGAAGASYATRDNWSLERGSLALWVKPLNWRGDDSHYHKLFDVKLGRKGRFLLYKYKSTTWGLTCFLDPGEDPRGKIYFYRRINDWRPGQWRHVAWTWTRLEGMALYLDGRRVASVRGGAYSMPPAGERMTFGADWERHGGRTVIDEVMIFDRMLAPEEVAALAGRPAPAPDPAAPRDLSGVALAHAVLGQQVVARIYPDCLGAPKAEAARLRLFPAGSRRAVRETQARLTRAPTVVTLDLSGLPLARYEARLTLLDSNGVRGTESLVVSKETNETWECARRIGAEDQVLPPFEPLRVRGDAAVCWGREYGFAPGGLVRSVRSQGRPLLAGPARLVLTPRGRAQLLEPKPLRVARASDTQAEFVSGYAAPGWRVRTRVTARYEGTVWTELRFEPEREAALDGLRIEIPLAPGLAKYFAYIAPARVDSKRWGYDALPRGLGAVWRREFLPSLWLGDERGGLGWYAESDEHWDIHGEDALEVERRGDAVVLRMNIARRPRRVRRPFAIAFGLQAAPVRPLPADWRKYQWVPSEDITRFFLGLRARPYPRPELAGKRPRGKVCYLYAYHRHFTNTLPRDPAEFREMLTRAKGYGLLCTPYTDTTFLPESSGDFLLAGEALRTSPNARYRGKRGSEVFLNAAGCHRSAFGDWFVWYVSHLVRHYGANGVYLDDMWPYGCANAAHGCGYVGPDGKRRRTYALRARLRTYRRIRAVLAATGKPFWITYHISAGRLPPLATFGDALLLGEDLNPRVRKNPDYTRLITPAQWRAAYLPQTWGVPTVVLPQFKMRGAWMRDPTLAERFMAAVVPHDLMAWPVFAHTATLMKFRAALDSFGAAAGDVRFIPCWDQRGLIRCSAPGVVVSAYQRPGKLLLCVANWSGRDAADTVVALRLRGLGLKSIRSARSLLTGRAAAVRGAEVVVSLPAGTLDLVAVESEQ